MKIDGLFGPEIETATDWGYLKLTDTTIEAAAAAGPAWLETLFPHTDGPDKFEHRLQRVETASLDVDGRQGGQVTCHFIYPEIDGKILTGTVKFFLPPVLADPGVRVPLLHVAGYEIDADGAMEYLKEGIAVSTIHDHEFNPLSRGPKLEWALLHAERRLPFVDDARVFIQGGSAGGYMALMTASETFPLVCVAPLVPPVNWAYNASYIAKSKGVALSHREGSEEPWLPVLATVSTITDQIEVPYGADTEAPVFFNLSPVRLIDGITAPVLTAFSTADMLVPIDQVSEDFIRPVDRADFPEGFTQDLFDLLDRSAQRIRLLDVLASDRREIFMETVPEDAGRYKADLTIDGESKSLPLPFSRTRQWSIVIIDEGAPEPHVGHFKYGVDPEFSVFWHWALDQGIRTDQLTPGKLALMMKRYQGVQPLDFLVTPAEGAPYTGQLLDFPQAERADVLRGLITFARDDTAANHLAEVYSALPAALKGLGGSLGDGSAGSVRQALARAAARGH